MVKKLPVKNISMAGLKGRQLDSFITDFITKFMESEDDKDDRSNSEMNGNDNINRKDKKEDMSWIERKKSRSRKKRE